MFVFTENVVSIDSKINMSTQTDAKEFTSISVQADEIALPCTVNQLKKENKVLKQRVKRQSSSLTSLKEVVRICIIKNLLQKTTKIIWFHNLKVRKLFKFYENWSDDVKRVCLPYNSSEFFNTCNLWFVLSLNFSRCIQFFLQLPICLNNNK